MKNLLLIQYFSITILLLFAISTYGQDIFQSSPYFGVRNNYPGWSNDRYNNRFNGDQQNLYNNYQGENIDGVVPGSQYGDGGDNSWRQNGPQIFSSPASLNQNQPWQESSNYPSIDGRNNNNYGNNEDSSSNQNQPWQESSNYPSNDDRNNNNYGNNEESRNNNDNEQTTISNTGNDSLSGSNGQQGLVSDSGNDYGQNTRIDSTNLTNVNNNITTVDVIVDKSNNTTVS